MSQVRILPPPRRPASVKVRATPWHTDTSRVNTHTMSQLMNSPVREYAPERWLPVLDYEGLYEVSNCGRVRSFHRSSSDTPPRVLRLNPLQSGYFQVALSKNGRKRFARVHRLVLESFIGRCPPEKEARHADGDRGNNYLGNLRWDTRRANALDTVRHGRNLSAARTHCPIGHRLVAPNLVLAVEKRGQRGCLACARERASAYQQGRTYSRPLADKRYRAIMHNKNAA